MPRHSLVYRFIIFNALIGALIIVLALDGLVSQAFTSDTSGLTYASAGVFTAAWLSTVARVLSISNQINRLRSLKDTEYTTLQQAYRARTRMHTRTRWLKDAPGWMVTLGLLGTVIGFAIALAGLDVNALVSVEDVRRSATALVRGMGTAVYTTLVGGALALWAEMNYRMLDTAIKTYWADVVDMVARR